jgi:hypothetical protein
MGTTVTPNINLIKPDTSESIQANLPTFPGWAVQNGLNCDVVDGLYRKSTHVYTPVWTADVTNPTLGAGGVVEGKLFRIFPRMSFVFFRIIMGGAGFNPGSGFYQISMPVNVATEFFNINDSTAVGKAYLHDSSTIATCNAFVTMFTVGGNKLFLKKNDGDAWRSSTPITLAQGDIVSGYAMLPTGDA